MTEQEYKILCKYCYDIDYCDICIYDKVCDLISEQKIVFGQQYSNFNDLTELQKEFILNTELVMG